MILLHTGTKEIVELVDGIRYALPPNEPVEIADNWHASKILERLPWAGIVEVSSRRTPVGIEYDVDGAIKRASHALAVAENAMVVEYVRNQMEERVRHGKPALPPEGRVAEIIIERGIDLAATYNIRPIGWGPTGPTLSTAGGSSEQVEELKRSVSELSAKLEAATSKVPVVGGDVESAVEAVLSVLPKKERDKAIKKLEAMAEAQAKEQESAA